MTEAQKLPIEELLVVVEVIIKFLFDADLLSGFEIAHFKECLL